MRVMRVSMLVAVLLPLWFVATAASSHAAYRRAAVPDDGRIVLRDYGLRSWGSELAHYTVDARRYPAGKVMLVGPDGEHELTVKDFVFPPVWSRPFVPLIEGALRQ